MRTEIKTYETVCDSCSSVLYDSGIRTNGGKFEEPYLKLGEIDLCYSCAGKIFYREVSRKVPEEKLMTWVKSLKKAVGPNPLGPDLETTELFPLTKDFGKYGWDKNNTIDCSKTTGVDEMVQVSSLEELTPMEVNQEAQNNMFKVQPESTIKFLEDL